MVGQTIPGTLNVVPFQDVRVISRGGDSNTPSLTFEGAVSVAAEGSLSITGSVQELTFESDVSVAAQASLGITGIGDGVEIVMGANTLFALSNGASLRRRCRGTEYPHTRWLHRPRSFIVRNL
jgi:hypothetical protein